MAKARWTILAMLASLRYSFTKAGRSEVLDRGYAYFRENFFPALRWIRAKGRAEAIKPRPSPLLPVPVRVYKPPRVRR
jgi:hypothetical protein